jgi:ABC transport system ATP-binding/permease protein
LPELLLSCQEIGKAFGARPLFESLSFGVFEGDRVGLVGPNGSGKSTLLKILAGLETPDTGTRAVRKRLRVGYVPQDAVFPDEATPESVLSEALADAHLEEFEKVTRIEVVLARAGFTDARQTVRTLSGGWKKRLAVARELAREPELLLLDEPTNHLDVEGIVWLEELLQKETLAYVVVSHDRYFLENVAARMLELSRTWAQGLFEVKGGYRDFLAQKDEALAGQAAYQDSLANKVRGELEWLSRKAKARTRKAQARIDEAGRLVDELADLEGRNRKQTAGIEFSASARKTRELLKVKDVGKSFGGRPIVRGLSVVLSPGLRLGLLGPNGSGKSTVLHLLSGTLAPDAGTVTRAPHLKVVEFHQDRSLLDPARTLRKTLSPDGDAVIHQGRSVHVAGWAKRFLFEADQLDQPVGRLSGGEQARVLIAKLMLEPADVLLLDEPTNDLDIPTLEVLEESLLEFPGALVLVTHDRYLLDRVSTRILALDGRGGARSFADYPQWELAQAAEIEAVEEAERRAKRPAPRAASAPRTPAAKLSYKEKQEWEGMEKAILTAEATLEQSNAAAHDPAIATNATALHDALARLHQSQVEVERLYARWAELEAKLK